MDDLPINLSPTTPDYSAAPLTPVYEPSTSDEIPQLPISSPTTDWKAPYEIRNEQEAQNEILPDDKEYQYIPNSPTYTTPFGEDDTRVAVPAKKEDFRELTTSEGKLIWVNNKTGQYYENNPFE